jgi:ribulose-bisphosphate carboxylase large chain
VTLAQPLTNIGHNLPALLSMVAGEGTFFTPGVPVARLEDLRFPDAWLAGFRGPREGVAGLRARHRAQGRPVFIGVIKPNLGLAPADLAALAESAWLGGLDIAKDDEMLVDTIWSPLRERAAQVGAARRRAEAASGRPLGYMANITDEVDRLRPLHDAAVTGGATALLVNALPVGLSGLRHVTAHTTVPVFTHFPMIAALGRVPGFGVHPQVLTRLQRLAGADAVIMPGFGPRMATPPDEVLACVRACLEPMGPIAPSLPCPGGSDWAGTVARVHAALGTVDFGFIAGRGVFGHPDGPGAGAASIRAAWEAVQRGESFEALAQRDPVVGRALDAFGR